MWRRGGWKEGAAGGDRGNRRHMDTWGGQRPCESAQLPRSDAHAVAMHLGGFLRTSGAPPVLFFPVFL